MSIRTRALFLTGLLAAVSCSDAGNPLAPEQPAPVPGLPSGAVQPLDCTVTVATGEMRCEIPQPDAGEASAAGQLIIGGQNVYVRLASTNFAVNADTIQFDVTVQNLIRQPIGTEDGVTVDSAGVRVFFSQDPVSNNPSGPASVANADGEAMFLAPDQPYFQWDEMLAQDEISGSRTWKLQYAAGSTSVSFRVYVAAQVQYPTGWIEIVPPTDTLLPSESTTLSATAYDRVGRTDRVDQVNFRWSTVSESGVVTVDSLTGEVTAGASSGIDTVHVTNDDGQEGFAVIVVNTPLVADDVTYPALGNVSMNVPVAFGLEHFVDDPDDDAVTIVEATDAATTGGGLITVNGDGSFSYRPAAGFTGTDTYTYTATDGTAFASGTLTLEVGDRYWFAQADQAGTGTMASPGTLKTAETGSAAGETIFVLHGGASTAGVDEGIVLKDGQALIGQGVSGSIVRMLSMPTGAADSLAVTLLTAGSAPGITRTDAGATVQLASGNTLRGLGISSTAGAGIAGTTFGTLTTGDAVSISATGGAALLLSDGALSGTFAQVASSGSTGAGLSLTNVTGALAPTGGNITNPAGAGVLVSGGSVNLTWTGNVTQPNNAPLVDVNGGHDGTIEFNTGTLSATNGSGLQFNGVSGGYTFAGTTTLNGGDAGVDITNGSDGATFVFGTSASITSPTGTAFNVYGSSPTVTYSGNVTKGNAGAIVEVGEQPGGSVTFQTGTLQATAGSGISLSNAGGTVAFNGTTTLSGGPSVAVVGGSAGTISFTSGASVTNPASAALLVSASAPSLTYAGTLSSNAARPAQIEGMTGGTVAVSGSVTGTGNGILVQNNNTGSGKTITFSGAVSLNTGANEAVTLANNTGATIGFTSGATDLTTTTGNAFAATGGGTVNLSGGSNDISTSTGSALMLNGITLGASGMSLATLNVSGAAVAPVVLTNVGVTTGSSITASGGSIAAGNGTRLAVSGGTVNVNWAGSISQSTHNASLIAVTGGHATGTLAFSGTLSASSGNGLQFDNADGTYNFTGTTTLNGGDAGIDVLNGSGGTFGFGTATSITNPSGSGVFFSGSTSTFTYSGSLSKNSAGWLVDTFNQASGTITFQTGNLSATGTSSGITFNNADGTVNFTGPTALSGGTARINVQGGSSGSINFGSGTSVSGPPIGVGALHVTNGNATADIEYLGSLTGNPGRPAHIEGVSGGTVDITGPVTSTGQGILLQNNAGGTITFSSSTKTLNTGANAAVTSTGSGASVVFSGGNLDIDVTSGAGFSFTGGGTVQVTGANNTVAATGGGTAVSIQNTTIGGSGISFYSVNATGGGTNGIVLSNTGAGGFQVTGDGASSLANTTRGRTTARSGGGSIVLGSGGTITGKSGDGINLSTTGAVTLRNLVVTSGLADGIDATGVGGLVLDNLLVSGHTNNRGVSVTSSSGLKVFHSEINSNATSASAGSGGHYNLQLTDVTGTDSIMSSALHTAFGFVMRVGNNSGTLNLRVENTQITGATNGIAAGVYAEGTSNVTANFQNDSIGHSSARGLQTATGTSSSAVLNLTVNGTAFRNNFVGMDLAHGSGGTYSFSVTNNNLQTNVGSSAMAINVNRLGSPSFNAFGLFTGTISGNTIGTAGTANSGSDTGSGIEVESNGSGGITRVAVVSNTIREVATHGIYVAAVDANIGGAAPPLLEARIASNSIANLEAVGLDGIHVLPGALSTDDLTMCLDIANNNSTGIRNGLRVRPSGLPAAPSTIQLEGWDGVTARSTYFTARPNTLAGGVAAYAEGTPSAPGGWAAVANCNTP